MSEPKLLSGRGGRWALCRSRLGLNGLRFESLKHRTGAAPLTGIHRQRNGGNHESDSGPCSRPGKGTGRAARTESRLAALSAESCGDVAAFSALQQNDDDDEEANQNVKRNDQAINHVRMFPADSRSYLCWNLLLTKKLMVRKGGFEPPRLSAPPPQDGVSASSTTSAQIRDMKRRTAPRL